MNVSAKTEYACLAMMELAARYDEARPVRIRDIAERHGIPARFLVQILLQLKGAGLVHSTRGANGGYALTKSPSAITLGRVMRVIEGESGPVGSKVGVPTSSSRVLLNAWNDVAAVERETLSRITFADLLRQAEDHSANMYYI